MIQELTGWATTKNVPGGIEVQLPKEYTKIVGNQAYSGPVVFIEHRDLNFAEKIGDKDERRQYLFHSSVFRRRWM